MTPYRSGRTNTIENGVLTQYQGEYLNPNQTAATQWSDRQAALREEPDPILTMDRNANAMLETIPDAGGIARRAAQAYASQTSGELPGWGRVGNEYHVGGERFVEDDEAIARQRLQELRKQLAARRMAQAGQQSRWDAFSQNPEVRGLLPAQQQSLYQASFGIDPYEEAEMQSKAERARLDAVYDDLRGLEAAWGANPIEALTYYDPENKVANFPQRKIRNPDWDEGMDESLRFIDQPAVTRALPDWLYKRIEQNARALGYQPMPQQQAPSRAALISRERELLKKAAMESREDTIERLAREAREFAVGREREYFNPRRDQIQPRESMELYPY